MNVFWWTYFYRYGYRLQAGSLTSRPVAAVLVAGVLSRAASTFVAASCAGVSSGAAAMRDGDAPPIGAVGIISIDCVSRTRAEQAKEYI